MYRAAVEWDNNLLEGSRRLIDRSKRNLDSSASTLESMTDLRAFLSTLACSYPARLPAPATADESRAITTDALTETRPTAAQRHPQGPPDTQR